MNPRNCADWIRVGLPWLVLAFLLQAAPGALAQGDRWVGKTVLPKHSRVVVASLNDKEKTVKERWSSYTAVAEEGSWVKVERNGGLVGWIKKGDLVPLDAAEAHFSSAIKASPKDHYLHVLRAHARLLTGRTDDCLADLAESIRLAPADPYPYVYRGNVRRSRGEYDRAVGDFDEAVRLSPKDPANRIARGEVHFSRGDSASGLADFKEAARIDPKNADALNHLAWAYLSLGQFDAALESTNKLIDLNDRDGSAFRLRGTVLVRLRQYEKAAKDFARGAELAPRDSNCLCRYAWFLAACPEAKYRDGKRSLELAGQALKLEKSRDALEALAAAHAEVGDFTEAVRHQEEAISLPIRTAEPEEAGRDRLELYKAKTPYRFKAQ